MALENADIDHTGSVQVLKNTCIYYAGPAQVHGATHGPHEAAATSIGYAHRFEETARILCSKHLFSVALHTDALNSVTLHSIHVYVRVRASIYIYIYTPIETAEAG